MSLLIQPARQEDFLSCREQVFERNFLQHGIGSLAEKSQHAILKNYYCPNPAEQEINLGPFVADIANREGVTEIQTKGFGSMGGPADRRDGRPQPLPQKDGGLRHLPGAVQRAGPAVARRILGDHRAAGV